MVTCSAKSVVSPTGEMITDVQGSLTSRTSLPRETAFIDPGIDGLSTLLAGLRLEVQAIVLDPAVQASLQIAGALQTRLGFEAIHTPIYNRPSEATFSAGALSLWGADGDEYAADLAEIGEVPGEENLNLRMCETPNGERFLAFVDAVAGMASTNVAASKAADRRRGAGSSELGLPPPSRDSGAIGMSCSPGRVCLLPSRNVHIALELTTYKGE